MLDCLSFVECKLILGELAHLVERIAGSDEVTGSIPVFSTITFLALVGVFIYKSFKNCEKNNFYVKKKRPVLNVMQIKLNPFAD